jgi:CubicO group peptidase (beta-lactamase class C family)/ketosteroid isomerase-like protein
MTNEPTRSAALRQALALDAAGAEPPPDLLPQLLLKVPASQPAAAPREPWLWALALLALAAALLGWMLLGWSVQPRWQALAAPSADAWWWPLAAAAALHALWPHLGALARRGAVVLGVAALSMSTHAQTSLDPLANQLAQRDLLRGAFAVQQGEGPLLERRIDGSTVEPYRIGSIGKTFTAVLALQLVEQGKLSLADPVSRWFPKLAGGDRITVEMLLRHRSGLGDVSQAPDFERWVRQRRTMAELQALVETLPAPSEPGQRARYNNTGYILLHWIVERAGGASYDSLLERGIAQPLGLVHTRMAQAGQGLPSFRREGERWVQAASSDPSVPLGAGALVSTPGDLVRFARGLFGGRLLKPETLAQMQTLVDGFGLGLTPNPKAGPWAMQGLGHEGAIDGFRAVLVHLPKQNLTAAVLLNAEHWPRDALLEAVLASRLEPGRALPDLTPRLHRWAIQLDPMSRSVPDGGRIALRGSAPPLSWERGSPLVRGGDGLWRTTLEWRGTAGLPLETKFVVESAAGQVLHWERNENRRWNGAEPAPALFRWDLKGETERLWAEVRAADAALFAAMQRKDAAAFAALFSERLEFFHDGSGLAGKAQTVRQTVENFSRNPHVRREPIEDGQQIHPLPGIGAMHIGQHRFCNRESESAPEQCSVYGFSHVWEKTPGGWQLLRVLSYGH